MILALAVGLAAGLGAVTRYGVDQLIQRRTDGAFPWGTFAVNSSGSLLLGLVAGLAARNGLPAAATVTLSAGFAGGFSTLSTWAWETLALAETGSVLEAAANIVASFAVGLAAAAAGLALAHL